MTTRPRRSPVFRAADVDRSTRELVERRRDGRLRGRGALVRRALLLADMTGLVATFGLAQLLFAVPRGNDRLVPWAETLVFVASLPVWVVAAQAYGLYERDEERTDHSTAEDLVGVFHLLTVGSWLLVGFLALTHLSTPNFGREFFFWTCGITLVSMFRVLARTLCRRSPAYIQNTVVVGTGPVGQLVARKVLQHREYGQHLAGFVDREPRERQPGLEHVAVLGGVDELPAIVRELHIDRVIFAFADTPSRDLVSLARELRGCDVQLDVVPRMFELTGPAVDVHDIEGLPLLALRPRPRRRPSVVAKRMVDVVLASLLLVVVSPLLAWIAWRIRRDSEGPVFFRQTRLGYAQRPFTCLKFRTMAVGTDPAEHRAYVLRALAGAQEAQPNGLFKLEQTASVTRFGRFLRRTSLDELPQLINVVRGEMSLVGPRPCLAYEVDSFEPHHLQRFEVPPGITGLWQVSARAHSTLREALDMDVTYVRNWSLWLDLRLLLRTPLQVVRPSGTG